MNTYNVREFAELIGVSVKTLQRWDRVGQLVPSRTPSNRRIYTDEHVNQIIAERAIGVPKEKKAIVYLRVSSHAQRPDLVNQRNALEQFCAARGIAVDDWVEEIGGGLNFKRPKFLKLVSQVVSGEVSYLVIAHKDRLARFGFELIEYLCAEQGCEIIVMNQQSLSPEQEMVQDLMTIVHCFSSRLYGLRNYKKSLQKALESHDESA